MRIEDGKKLRLVMTEQVADTIPLEITYGPRLTINRDEEEHKVMVFVNADNFKPSEVMEVMEQAGHIEFMLEGSVDSTIKELIDVADSLMISIEEFDINDLEFYKKDVNHLIVMSTPNNTHHLMYSNKDDITKVTTGQFPCEMKLTEKNAELIYNDLITIKKTLSDLCPEKLSKISVLVEI